MIITCYFFINLNSVGMNRLWFPVLVSFSLLLSCNSPTSKKVPLSHTMMMEKASRSEKNGWIAVHLEGTPEVIGYQHGYLLAEEIIDCAVLWQC